jgi:hypothetical protein
MGSRIQTADADANASLPTDDAAGGSVVIRVRRVILA